MKSYSPLFRGLAVAACLAMSGAAAAQSQRLVPMSEFYFDEDARTAQPIAPVKGSGDALVDRLLKLIARNPHAKEETAQLAHIAMEGGRPELGRELYGRVLAGLNASDGLWRPVLWNYGWDLYRQGDHAGALAQWQTMMQARSVSAQWIPTTFALVLWQLDRKDEAVQWYAAAVRTEPGKWNSPGRYAELLPDWREEDRAVLAEVQQAWAANPPEWR